MRIDARTMPDPYAWRVYDAEECRVRTDIVWVDDETHEYGELSSHSYPFPEARQARRIAIYPQDRFVIINPIEGVEDTFTSTRETITV
jgi:hypothetical protein